MTGGTVSIDVVRVLGTLGDVADLRSMQNGFTGRCFVRSRPPLVY